MPVGNNLCFTKNEPCQTANGARGKCDATGACRPDCAALTNCDECAAAGCVFCKGTLCTSPEQCGRDDSRTVCDDTTIAAATTTAATQSRPRTSKHTSRCPEFDDCSACVAAGCRYCQRGCTASDTSCAPVRCTRSSTTATEYVVVASSGPDNAALIGLVLGFALCVIGVTLCATAVCVKQSRLAKERRAAGAGVPHDAPHACALCDKRYETAKLLERHTRLRHEEAPVAERADDAQAKSRPTRVLAAPDPGQSTLFAGHETTQCKGGREHAR